MKVQELLKLANIDEQVKLVCKYQPSYEKPYNPIAVKEAQSKFIEMLLGLTPKFSDSIIVFERHWDSLDDEVSEYIASELYEKDDLNKYFDLIKDEECPIKEYDENDNAANLKALCYKFAQFPIPYAFEFTEWEEVLGWDVYQDNIEELGLQECIYAILYEMSFNGMTREHQEERRQELKDSENELDEILKLPKEEQESHFISAEDMFKHWKEEFDWEEPSQEEKAEFERQMWLSSLKTAIWKFENFKRMIKNIRNKINI